MTPTLRPILLAEDNPADVELTLNAFRSMKIANEIATVGDGADALDYLERHGSYAGRVTPDPALLLLDLKMPKIDGLQLLRHLRASPKFRHLPVVVFTSSREEQDIVRSYEFGTNAYVVKPVDFQEFISAIGALGMFWALLNEPFPESHTS